MLSRLFKLFAVVSVLVCCVCCVCSQEAGAQTLPDVPNDIQSELPAGQYNIGTSYNCTKLIDVNGCSTSDGANVQIWSVSYSNAQRFTLSYDKQGYATITNSSGKVLDVSGALAQSGANVCQYTNKNSANQKWIITKVANGYKITSALSQQGKKALCLDVACGSSNDGANIEIYEDNGGANQKFNFYSLANQKVEGQKVVDDGIYNICAFSNKSKVLDVVGNSTADGANIDLWSSNKGQNQKFSFKYEEATKCYIIYSISSNMVLNAHCGCPVPLTNVNQTKFTNNDSNKWAITKRADGSLQFVNRASGLALDAECNSTADGTNIETYTINNNSAQKFTVQQTKLLDDGIYNIQSNVASNRYLDLTSGTWNEGTQVKTYSGPGDINQKYVIKAKTDDTYAIRSVSSGMLIADSASKVVQTNTSNKNSEWKVVWTSKGLSFVNVGSEKAMDVSGGSTALSTPVVTFSPNSSVQQSFRCVNTDIVSSSGTYFISPQCAINNSLQTRDYSWNPGSQVWSWAGHDNVNGKWKIERANESFYRISLSMNDYVIDVANGATHDNDKIQTYAWNGGAPQLWKLEFTDDGWFTFINATAGKALDVFGAKSSSGADVGIYKRNNSSSQKWRLGMTTPYSISGNSQLDSILKGICKGHTSLASCFDYVVAHGYRHGDTWPGGNWTVPYAIEMETVGSGNCYRFAALFMWCARALGYSANAICGQVPSASGGLTPHGWVEVYLNGQTYVCDPDLAHELPGHNWYMTTYAAAPIDYYK